MSTYNFLYSIISNQMNIFFSLAVPQFNGLASLTLLDTTNRIIDTSISSPTINDLPSGLKIVAIDSSKTIVITYTGKKIFIRNLNVSVDVTKDSNSQWTLDFSLTSGNFIQFSFILGIEYDFGVSNGEPNEGWNIEKVIEPTHIYTPYRVSVGENQSVTNFHIAGGFRVNSSVNEINNSTLSNYINHLTDTSGANPLTVNLDTKNLVNGREINLINVKGSDISSNIKIVTKVDDDFSEAIKYKTFTSFPKNALIKCLYNTAKSNWLISLNYLSSGNLDKALDNTETTITTQTTKRTNANLIGNVTGYNLNDIIISSVSYENITNTSIYDYIYNSEMVLSDPTDRKLDLLVLNLVNKSVINILQDYLLVYNPSSTKNVTVPIPIRFTNTTALLNRMKDGLTGADPYKLEIKLDGTFYSMNSHAEFTTLASKLELLGITLTPYFIRNMDSVVIGSRTTSLTTDIFIAEDRDSTTLLTRRQFLSTGINGAKYYASGNFKAYVARYRKLDYYRLDFYSGTNSVLNVSDKFLIFDKNLGDLTSYTVITDKSIFRNYNYFSTTDIRRTNEGNILYTATTFSTEQDLAVTAKSLAFVQTAANTNSNSGVGITISGLDEPFIVDTIYPLKLKLVNQTITVTQTGADSTWHVILMITLNAAGERTLLTNNIIHINPGATVTIT
jgi:hypothetical protein